MFETVDLYCERVGSGLWAEPTNAFTNLVFLCAAFATWRLAVRRERLSFGVWLLTGLMAVIGVGSGLFHTFATNWARVLDVLPILFFQMAYLWIYGHLIIRVRSGYLAGALVLFLVTVFFARQFSHLLNGSLGYAPAFVLLLGLGVYHFRYAQNQHTMLLWAAGLFLLSLFFRTIDQEVCAYSPIGTHFLWHIFNGLLVFLAARALLMNLPAKQERPA